MPRVLNLQRAAATCNQSFNCTKGDQTMHLRLAFIFSKNTPKEKAPTLLSITQLQTFQQEYSIGGQMIFSMSSLAV
jgi:hypothetical protein